MEADISGLVTPIHAEAHTLPFAAAFFEAIVSFDAYQYFGTADLYLGYLVDLLKPGGQIGVVMPATTRELGDEIPTALERVLGMGLLLLALSGLVADPLDQDPQSRGR